MRWKVVFMALALGFMAAGCGASNEELAVNFQDAINAGDSEAASAMLAEDVVWQVEGKAELAGKAAIEDWLALQVDLKFRLDGTPTASDAGASFQDCSVSSDKWRFYGVDPMTGTCQLTFESGLVSGFVVQFDSVSKAELAEFSAPDSEDLLGIWVTKNYLTESGDLYLQL